MSKDNFKNIRPALTAGQYYPADKGGLEYKIKNYLEAVLEQKTEDRIKAVMVPHASYDFSAPVAAYAFKMLQGRRINTAVIICNSHSIYFDGVVIDEHDGWETPLGMVPVDQELAKKLVASNETIKFNSGPFKTSDQTLEVQVPFLQAVLEDGFKIVPIFFGNQHDNSYKKLAEALARNLGEDDIIIISTDMSHYPSYEDANRIDKETLEIIKSRDISRLEEHIINIEGQNIPGEETLLCGVDGVKTVMELANLESWDQVEVLRYANSGDVLIGNKNSVVGYGAVAFMQTQTTPNPSLSKEGKEKAVVNLLNEEQKEELLKIARQTVESYVRDGKVPEFKISDERLNRKEGAFVTLHKDGQLRGCIGQIIPSEKPLWQVVREMAIAAATEDNRFNPVQKNELEKLDYEVSVLSVPETIDDWQKIELGKHGVIVQKGLRGGVFLPQVADETSWSREEFLSQLCFQKAGLPPDCYKDKNTELQVFTAQVFGEDTK